MAARCCAYLLRKAGFKIAIESSARGRVPAIMLSEHALLLIRDVFDQPRLFEDLPRIKKRIVSWGQGNAPVEVDNSAVVVSEEALLNGVLPDYGESAGEETANWIIHSAPNPDSVAFNFGSRRATAAAAELTSDSTAQACWIEALQSGWLFLISDGPGKGWLLAVGSHPDELLGQSVVIAPRIATLAPTSREFPAFPRIVSPLSAPGWLTCGTAAMAFDPICGDGTAHAIREAILTTAVIKAASRGDDIAALLEHYNGRLTAGFQRHLGLCLQYYKTGGESLWWNAEAACLESGLMWCTEKLSQQNGFHYRLDAFDLYRTD